MLPAVLVGTMTHAMQSGVDAYYAQHGKLPSRYLTKEQAKVLGWRRKKGNLGQILPGAVIGGDIYYNDDEKLPSVPGGFGTKQILTIISVTEMTPDSYIPTMV